MGPLGILQKQFISRNKKKIRKRERLLSLVGKCQILSAGFVQYYTKCAKIYIFFCFKTPLFFPSWTSGWAIRNLPLPVIKQTSRKDRWSVLRLRRQTETSAPSPLQFVSVYAALAGDRMDAVHHECKWSAWFDISNKPVSVYWRI